MSALKLIDSACLITAGVRNLMLLAKFFIVMQEPKSDLVVRYQGRIQDFF